MEARGQRRRLRLNNRQRLIARWRDAEGEQKRAGLLAALRGRESLSHEIYGEPADELAEREPPLGADLRGLDLSGETLDGVDLSGARLQGANLARASFRGANLVGADLRDTLLRHTDFTGADLREASFDGAMMERTIFVDADLQDASTSRSAIAVETFLPPSLDLPRPSLWFGDFPGGPNADDPRPRRGPR